MLRYQIFGKINQSLYHLFENFLVNNSCFNKSKKIMLEINSVGGDMLWGHAMINLIKSCKKCTFIAKILSSAISCAGLLALNCKKIIFAPESFIYLHLPKTKNKLIRKYFTNYIHNIAKKYNLNFKKDLIIKDKDLKKKLL